MQTLSATLTISADPLTGAIPRRVFGNFMEHLGFSADGGVLAQALANPTFERDANLNDRQVSELLHAGRLLVQFYRAGLDPHVFPEHWSPGIGATGFGVSALDDYRAQGVPFPWAPLGGENAVSASLGRIGGALRIRGARGWEGAGSQPGQPPAAIPLDDGPCGVRQGVFLPFQRCLGYHGHVWARIAAENPADETLRGVVEVALRRRLGGSPQGASTVAMQDAVLAMKRSITSRDVTQEQARAEEAGSPGSGRQQAAEPEPPQAAGLDVPASAAQEAAQPGPDAEQAARRDAVLAMKRSITSRDVDQEAVGTPGEQAAQPGGEPPTGEPSQPPAAARDAVLAMKRSITGSAVSTGEDTPGADAPTPAGFTPADAPGAAPAPSAEPEPAAYAAAGEVLAYARLEISGGEWVRLPFALLAGAGRVSTGEPVDFVVRWLPQGGQEAGSSAPDLLLDRAVLLPDDAVEDTFDPDVLRLVREWGVPLLRWPGGNFVSHYHWRDGVGPLDRRPTRRNEAWGGLETNFMGTREFIRFCRLVGAEPHITVNTGTGSPEEAAAWVDYCNSPVSSAAYQSASGAASEPANRAAAQSASGTESSLASGTASEPASSAANGSASGAYPLRPGGLRAAHGDEQPYDVRLWEVGNEVYGAWQGGYHGADENALRFVEFAAAMRAVDPSIELIATGNSFDIAAPRPALDHTNADRRWNRKLYEQAAGQMDYLSLHCLPANDLFLDRLDHEQAYYALMAQPDAWERVFLPELWALALTHAREGRAPAGEGRAPARIAITEWGVLGPRGADRPVVENYGEVPYAGLYLNMAVRNCERAPIHNATALLHGGCIRKAGGQVFYDPQYTVIQQYTALAGGVALRAQLDCPTYDVPTPADLGLPLQGVPFVDAVVVRLEDGARVLCAVNRHRREPITLTVRGEGLRQAHHTTLAHPDVTARARLGDPERFKLEEREVEAREGEAILTLPACSVSWVRF